MTWKGFCLCESIHSRANILEVTSGCSPDNQVVEHAVFPHANTIPCLLRGLGYPLTAETGYDGYQKTEIPHIERFLQSEVRV